MTEQTITIEAVHEKLRVKGFTGLYYPGECGCELSDLAPCGNCKPGGEYMNDCKPGYKHLDPNPGRVEYGDFVVTNSKEPPSPDEFENLYN